MPSDRAIRRYRLIYSWLLRLFPRGFRDRFGEGMRQTFHDICRERAVDGRGVHLSAIRCIADTMLQIPKQHSLRNRTMRRGVAAVIACTGLILTIPAMAMRSSDEVNWTAFDFVVAGTLLLGSGLTAEYLWRRTPNVEYRAGSVLAVFTGLFVVWVNLAVGIIGNEDHPANGMYAIVLLIGVAYALSERLRPAGMVVALNLTAIAMTAVPVIAYCIWRPPLDMGLFRTVMFNTFIALAFAASARLFRSASIKIPAAT
jgi:hypothetical protein